MNSSLPHEHPVPLEFGQKISTILEFEIHLHDDKSLDQQPNSLIRVALASLSIRDRRSTVSKLLVAAAVAAQTSTTIDPTF